MRDDGLELVAIERALFLEERKMSELESKHYLMNGGETLPDAREALEWAAETRGSK